jgi:hypothetical protein
VAQCSTLALHAKIKLDQNVSETNALAYFCSISFNEERKFHKIDTWCHETFFFVIALVENKLDCWSLEGFFQSSPTFTSKSGNLYNLVGFRPAGKN